MEAGGSDDLVTALRTDELARGRVIGALGISSSLVDHLVAHPEQ